MGIGVTAEAYACAERVDRQGQVAEQVEAHDAVEPAGTTRRTEIS